MELSLDVFKNILDNLLLEITDSRLSCLKEEEWIT